MSYFYAFVTVFPDRRMFSTLPNRLSLLRIILSPVFYVFFVSEDPTFRHVSLGIFFIAAITDWYDGIIARKYNTVTNIGKFLDPLADKFLTSAAFIAFASLGHVEWWMVWLIIIRDLLITVLRSIAEARGAHIVTSKTAQSKTFLQMAVLYYLLLLIILRDVGWVQRSYNAEVAALLHPTVVFVLMFAVTVLTLYTGIQYLYDNRHFLRGLVAGSHSR